MFSSIERRNTNSTLKPTFYFLLEMIAMSLILSLMVYFTLTILNNKQIVSILTFVTFLYIYKKSWKRYLKVLLRNESTRNSFIAKSFI